MPYIKEVCRAGKTIEVGKYYSSRYGIKGIKRSANHAPTPEQMQRANERAATKKLRRIINTNFGLGDIHLVLTYRRDLTPTPDEARKHLERFLRKARGYYAQAYGRDLKYITVTEYKRARVHHHLILPSLSMTELYGLWQHGRPHITPLDATGQYGQLAEYLIKETAKTFAEDSSPYKKRWNQSKNMIPPTVKKEIIQANSWRKKPKAIAGYYVDKDSVCNGECEGNGCAYQFYTMIMLGQKARGGEVIDKKRAVSAVLA